MRKSKIVISLILIITILSISIQSLAANFNLNVIFDGKNISMESETTDMSWNLENFLPGDSDTSSITITNTGEKTATVETSINIEEDTGLLEKIDLTVTNSKSEVVYTGTYTELKTISKSLKPGESETYTAYTSLNINAGNEYQNKQYKLKFSFKAIGEVPYGTLTVKYVDQDGKDLEPATVDTKKITSENYNLPATGKDFEGYRFDRVEGEISGEYKEEGVTVTYYYNKIKYGTLTVKHIDDEGNILEQSQDTKEVGTDYSLSSTGEEITGYTFERVEGEISGKYKEEDTIVTYVYKKIPEIKTGRLIIRYVDQDENILEEEIQTKEVGTPYELDPMGKEIEGYDFITIVGDYIGVYKEEDTVVSYKYKKREYGKVIVVYVDENENILEQEITTGIVDYPYGFTEEYVKKEIPGYEFKKIEGELTGVYKKEDTIIYCRYELIKSGRLIVVAIDENNEVIKQTITTKRVGTEYNLGEVGEEIEGYTFLGVEGETSGKYKVEDTIVTYRYERIKEGPVTEDVKLPQTGQFKYLYAIPVVVIVSLASVIIFKNRKKGTKQQGNLEDKK